MQDLLVYLVVAAAAFYLVRMLIGAVAGKKSSCNGCGSNCASQTKEETPQPLIQISSSQLNGRKK